MDKVTVRGRIEYTSQRFKGYNREFTATLYDSAAFDYGNKTAVRIEWGACEYGKLPTTYLDTRYDRSIKCDRQGFIKWLKDFFANEVGDAVTAFIEGE